MIAFIHNVINSWWDRPVRDVLFEGDMDRNYHGAEFCIPVSATPVLEILHIICSGLAALLLEHLLCADIHILHLLMGMYWCLEALCTFSNVSECGIGGYCTVCNRDIFILTLPCRMKFDQLLLKYRF
jgi:hypothetical protein